MSSSITIPRRRKKLTDLERDQAASGSSMSSPSLSSPKFASSFASSSGSPPRGSGEDSRTASALPEAARPARRLSLLSSSLAKADYTVVNVGSPEAPRLITCVKASQGFDWNQEIFLPSYIDHDSGNLERRQEPVRDIILTDEEAASLLPQ